MNDVSTTAAMEAARVVAATYSGMTFDRVGDALRTLEGLVADALVSFATRAVEETREACAAALDRAAAERVKEYGAIRWNGGYSAGADFRGAAAIIRALPVRAAPETQGGG